MREIPEPKPWHQGSMFKPSSATCPRCQGQMVQGPVRCPDGMEGVLRGALRAHLHEVREAVSVTASQFMNSSRSTDSGTDR